MNNISTSENMHVLVVGASGYVGKYVVRALSSSGILFSAISGVRQGFTRGLELALEKYPTSCVVNCGGYVGRPNVDSCEKDTGQTWDSNVVLPLEIAEICRSRGVDYGHVSSGCIYSGDVKDGSGYPETAEPNFRGSWYSCTKSECEKRLRDAYDHVWIWRMRMPIDSDFGERSRNTLAKLAKYPTIVDAVNSFTWLPEFSSAIAEFCRKKLPYGTWNLVQPGTMSNREIVEILERHKLCEPGKHYVSVGEFSESVIAQRSFCHLSSKKANSVGLMETDVHEALYQAINDSRNIGRQVV